jgi:hypothetical protein
MTITVDQTQQGGEGVRTTTATPGGTITVNVGTNESTVKVVDNSSGDSTTVPVTPGKDTSVPIPNVPGGSYVTIEIGRGINKRVIRVEVIAPSP